MLERYPDPLYERTETASKESDILRIRVLLDGIQSIPSTLIAIVLLFRHCGLDQGGGSHSEPLGAPVYYVAAPINTRDFL